MNNLIYLVMDSCRYDSFVSANTDNFAQIGPVEKRFSYASWTSPSHMVMLMGLCPHTSPKGVFASEVYKEDFVRWRDRLDAKDLEFKSFVPELSLPYKLGALGYRTVGKVSLPVLNEYTVISNHFDEYKLMDNHNDFAGMIDEMTFEKERPTFYFCNLGETHYPYMLTREEAPVIHGVHGVFKRLDDMGEKTEGGDAGEKFFDMEKMDFFRERQIKSVEYLNRLMQKLFDKCPDNTYFIVTSDHGELFGEEGYFGHGPIIHDKVFEVPFMEGRL